MKPKIVILRGAPATGKTTALKNLRKNKKMNKWIIIDFSELKSQFAHLGDEKRKYYGKQALFGILKILMQQKLNILFDEMSGVTIKGKLKYHIRKYNYKLIVMEFTANIKTSIKREAERRIKKNMEPRGEKWVHKTHRDRLRHVYLSDSIFIDTTKLNKKQVVDFIIKKLK